MNADQTTDEEIRKLRSVLFPAIGIQIITGFNVYGQNEQKPVVSSDDKNVRISYLHEDLVQNAPHYEQIKRMLEKYCDQAKIQKIEHEVISRFSSYLLEEDWPAKEYFLIDQTHVKKEDVAGLIKQNITVIGCGSQNELIITCEMSDINAILEQFRLYANKYEVDLNTGEYVYTAATGKPKSNPHETWTMPWEVPCIIVNTQGMDEIKTYARVRKISFDLQHRVASLFIGNKWDLAYKEDESSSLAVPTFRDYLAFKSFKPSSIDSNYFANLVFFNWINAIKWERVAKTKESYKHIFEKL